MAKTFKVGDKVRILDVSKILCSYDLTNGRTYEIIESDAIGDVFILDDDDCKFKIYTSEFNAIELVDATPTKKQRIKALENEVEALKARIEALENGAIPNNETGRNYIASKMAEALKRHLEAEQQTPNQRRKAVIDRAKAFVAEIERNALKGHGKLDCYMTKPEYHINKEKRVVTALVKGAINPKLYEKAIARCAPGDVFNEHIGKAIALAKAYGLECPEEFTDAPQPEPAIGQLIKNNGSAGGTYKATGITKVGVQIQNSSRWFELEYAEILDDTEVQYE